MFALKNKNTFENESIAKPEIAIKKNQGKSKKVPYRTD